MIITLNKADFSGNNIGIVVIDRDVSPETLELLQNYTKGLTKTQQLAVDDLLINLKNAGIYSKINHLFLPILAGTKDEAFFDAITRLPFVPVKPDGYILADNGLKLGANANNTNAAPILPSNMPLCSDCHFGTYMTENLSGGNYILGSGTTVNTPNAPFWLNANPIADPSNPINTENNVQIGSHSASVRCSMDKNTLTTKGFKIASNKGTDATHTSAMYSGIAKIKAYKDGVGLPNANSKLNGILFGFVLDDATRFTTTPQALVTVGAYLTDDEMVNFDSYVNNMMRFF